MVEHVDTGLKIVEDVEVGESGLWVGDFGTRVRELFEDEPVFKGDLFEYPSHW